MYICCYLSFWLRANDAVKKPDRIKIEPKKVLEHNVCLAFQTPNPQVNKLRF